MHDDPQSTPLPPDCDWLAHYGVSRRSVVMGAATSIGFAAACHPVASTAKNTTAEGLDVSTASVKAADGFAVPLFIAKPKGGKPAPVIIVVHEVFGVHEWIRDMCRRFAHAGFMAVAPDLFARAGDATKVSDMQVLFKTIVAPTPDTQVLSDIDTVVDWADKNGAATGLRGITGFCWGGRIVWLYATHSASMKAGVAFYGRLTGDQELQPLKLVNQMKFPVLGQYGGRDKGIPQSDVEAMNAALKAAGNPSHIIVHPDADHGFMADYRPSYNEAAAKQAWAAALDWFHSHLGR
jgi:carboxymethylenebutenolidase